MSKEVSFPVMSFMLSGVLVVLGILLATLGILSVALALGTVVTAILYFIGLFLFG